MSGEPLKPWERPWTLQEMRDHAANWSLAGDAGLLNCLTQLSQEFIQKMESTSNSVDSLCADLEHAQSDLANVSNSFNLLAHNQFVENRVAEEDEKSLISTSKQKDVTQLPHNFIETQMKEVVKNSLAFLEEMFESVEDSASNQRDTPAEKRQKMTLKPINPYANRPLPHIIGTREFDEDDTLGLQVSANKIEEEEEDVWERPILDRHVQRQEQFLDNASSMSDKIMQSDPEEDDDNEDNLFSPPPKPPALNLPPTLVPEGRPMSFADELASKLGVSVTPQPVSQTKPQSQQQQSQVFPSLDEREPPGLFDDDNEEEEEDSIFGTSKGLFSGGRGLFTDEPKTTPPINKSKEKVEKPVFDDESQNDDVFTTPPVKPTPQKPSNLDGLFQDDTEEDALFSPQLPTPRGTKNSVLLFSDEEDLFAAPSPGRRPQPEPVHDIFDEPPSPVRTQPLVRQSPPPLQKSTSKQDTPDVTSAPTKKLPAGAVSMFGGQQVFPASVLRRQASSSSESSAGVGESLQKETEREQTPPKLPFIAQKVPSKLPSVGKSLFENDSEDDLFGEKKPPSQPPSQMSSEKKTTSISETPKPAKISLFDDSDEDDFMIPAQSRPATLSKSNLFSDSPPQTRGVTEKPTILFDEPSPKISLFSDEDEQPPIIKIQPKSVEKHTVIKSKVSLFNDSESDDDILFSSASSGSSKSSKLLDASKVAARHGLFDDDWKQNKNDSSSLFEEEDLFSTAKVVVNKSVESSDSIIPEVKKTAIESKDTTKKSAPQTKILEEDSLFDAETSKNQNVESSDHSKKTTDLFADDTGDLFKTDVSQPVTEKQSSQDDLFASRPLQGKIISDEKVSTPVESAQNLTKSSLDTGSEPAKSLFDSEDDSKLFSQSKLPPNVPKKPEVVPRKDTEVLKSSENIPTEKVPEKEKIGRAEPPKSLDVTSVLTDPNEKGDDDLFSASWSSHSAKKPQEISTLKPQSSGSEKKISPVQRGLGLKINPLALLPGGKSVKPYKSAAPSLSSPTEAELSPTPSSPSIESSPKVSEEVIPSSTPPLVSTPPVLTPPISSPTEETISFDSPLSTNILQCPGKDRIRIQQKRKPATRRGRQTTSTLSPTAVTPEVSPAHNDTETTPAPSVSPPPPSAPPVKPRTFVMPPLLDREPPPLPPSNPMSPSTDEEDVFDLPAEDDEDNLFTPIRNSLPFDSTSLPTDQLFPDLTPSSDKISDLFSDKQSDTPKIDKHLDSLFSDNEIATTKVENIFTNASLFPSEPPEDDLFSEPSIKTTSQDVLTKNETVSESPGISEKTSKDTAVDKFYSEPISTQGTTKSESVLSQSDIFSSNKSTSLDTDLFSGQVSTQQTAKSDDNADSLFQSPQTDLFSTKSSDLFSSQKTPSLDNDLFGGVSTSPKKDLFASIESPKSQTSSPVVENQTPVKPAASKQLIDDDLFGTPKQELLESTETTKSEISTPAPVKKQSNDDDLFGAISSTTKKDLFGTIESPKSQISSPILEKLSAPKKQSLDDDLFGDVSTPKADLFGSIESPKSQISSSILEKQTAHKNQSLDDDLFGDVSSTPKEDLFGTIETPKSQVTSPILEKQRVGPAKKQSLDDDLFGDVSSPKEYLFGSVETPKSQIASPILEKQPTPVKPATSKPSLDDDLFGGVSTPKEDLFGTIETPKPQISSPIVEKQTAPKNQSLDDDLFGAGSTTPKQDLFASIDSPKSQISSPSTTKQTSTPVVPAKKKSIGSIFDDDDTEEDFFTASSKPVVTKPSPKAPPDLFGDNSDDEGDLFSSSSSSGIKSKAQTTKSTTTSRTKTTVKKLSDEQDEFDDPLLSFQKE